MRNITKEKSSEWRARQKQLGISKTQGGGDNGWPINSKPQEIRPNPTHEWIDATKSLPKEGSRVTIEEAGTGTIVGNVLFERGHFWIVQKGSGGQAYMVIRWKK